MGELGTGSPVARENPEEARSAQALTVKNEQLALQMKTLKESQYGPSVEESETLELMSRAGMKETLVREKINAVYGEKNFEKLYADGVTFRELAFATYSADQNSGLEISDENVPQAQTGNSWEQVDPSKSEGRETVSYTHLTLPTTERV